jgi:hypothetical protein
MLYKYSYYCLIFIFNCFNINCVLNNYKHNNDISHSNIPCGKNANCVGNSNMYCNLKIRKCVCDENYFFDHSKSVCIRNKMLLEKCEMDAECDSINAVCNSIYNVCMCKPGYKQMNSSLYKCDKDSKTVPNFSEILYSKSLKLYGQQCYNSYECKLFMICLNGKCKCHKEFTYQYGHCVISFDLRFSTEFPNIARDTQTTTRSYSKSVSSFIIFIIIATFKFIWCSKCLKNGNRNNSNMIRNNSENEISIDMDNGIINSPQIIVINNQSINRNINTDTTNLSNNVINSDDKPPSYLEVTKNGPSILNKNSVTDQSDKLPTYSEALCL